MDSFRADNNIVFHDRRPRIMIVDDDEINSAVTCEMLKEEFDVLPVSSGEEVLEKLRVQIPDLMLLDVHMPGLSGHDVIAYMKSCPEYAGIPVVFLTADGDEESEVRGLREGAEDFIRKPMRKNVALIRIWRLLQFNYLQNNLKHEVARQTEIAEKRLGSIERMTMQMVKALANTIDAKDSYTNGHSARVAKYSVMIAKQLGYTDDELTYVEYAALLHDIGKIGIPGRIINKPSRLTDEEYEIIKTHPSIGGSILQEITEIPDIAIGARWHHERYDGKGYPDGIDGEQIPEIARIIGVADAYDAMTSNRSYRGILPQSFVREEMEKGKGVQHDARISEIMIGFIDQDTEYEMHE